jgi:integrase
MSVVHLTEIVISRLKTPGTYFDVSTPAFGVRVGKNRKSWIVIRGRERIRTRIGTYPAISLAQARRQALVLLGSPLQRQPEIPKFDEALQRFYDVHVRTLKPKTQYQMKRILNRYFAKRFKHKRLDEIIHLEITEITDKLVATAPSEAWHAFKDARTFFRWCVPRFIKHSPMEGLKSPTKYVPRKRVLTNEELAIVWQAASEVGYPFGTALQLSILWGTRWGETISCRRSFVDENERKITLPQTKNGRQHCFPYGDMTAAILASIPHRGDTDLLFPGKHLQPWNGSGKAKFEFKQICRIAPWQILDLRRTFATKLAELGVAPHIVERLLNHKLGSLQTAGVITAVADVYNRALYMDEMRDAVAKWERRLTALVEKRPNAVLEAA